MLEEVATDDAYERQDKVAMTHGAEAQLGECRIKLVSGDGKYFDADRPAADKTRPNAIVAAVPRAVSRPARARAASLTAGASPQETRGARFQAERTAAGAAVSQAGTISGGNAGSITLTAGRTDQADSLTDPASQRLLVMDGTLIGNAMEGATGGSLALVEHLPRLDSRMAAGMLRAGAILMGMLGGLGAGPGVLRQWRSVRYRHRCQCRARLSRCVRFHGRGATARSHGVRGRGRPHRIRTRPVAH